MAFTTIDDPSAYFKVQLYTGNGAANHAITFDDTDTDMQPDFVWIKNRDTTDQHCLFDSVRGATKVYFADANSAESTDADTLDSFASDGFQVDADVKVNTSDENYVSWNWKAGTTGSGTTSGGGTGQAYSFSASTTAGFSITQYEGNGTDAHTIPHSLGVIPTVVWVKNRDNANGWFCMQPNGTSDPWTDFMYLDLPAASADEDTAWSDSQPTSSVVTLGNAGSSNTNAQTYMMYAWTPIQGYSKFGTYIGNASDDGPFVWCGFRPAFILVKKCDASNSWTILDNKRDTANPLDNIIWPDATGAEDDGTDRFNFLSNGFKCVNGDGSAFNTSDSTYFYAAFAYSPFVNSNGVPNNAR